jgi:methylmalonyl-CoA epimerase
MLKKINHIAIAVNNVEEGANFYQNVLGLDLSGVEVVMAQKTRVGFFKIGESNIELVQPAEPDSPLVKFLETKGQGIHHICFEVDDVEAEVKAFSKREQSWSIKNLGLVHIIQKLPLSILNLQVVCSSNFANSQKATKRTSRHPIPPPLEGENHAPRPMLYAMVWVLLFS